ncbi:hypothetical protein Tco_0552195 [Tanacetum coccineum]
MFVVMPLDNLELCKSKDSVSGVYIMSRFPIDCKSIELSQSINFELIQQRMLSRSSRGCPSVPLMTSEDLHSELKSATKGVLVHVTAKLVPNHGMGD